MLREMFGRRAPGKDVPRAAVETAEHHFVNGRPLKGPYPEGMQTALFGMGCFWGAERMFWEVDGVWVTSVGYAGGTLAHPTYREVCSGATGHAEVVCVVFDPVKVSYGQLLREFWSGHNPTQRNRQGNDIGTQYRSVIFTASATQRAAAEASRDRYQVALTEAGFGAVVTELASWPEYHYAEEYHQQYLARNPNGYCGLGGTGVSCPGAPD